LELKVANQLSIWQPDPFVVFVKLMFGSFKFRDAFEYPEAGFDFDYWTVA
jgi:hypothetical protein